MPKNSNPEESDQKNEGDSSNENPKNDDIKSSSKEALSLFEEQEKREARKSKKKDSGVDSSKVGGILPPISKLIEEEAGDSHSEKESNESISDDPNVIHIKPPIILKDLADKMGIKPFNIIRDLMGLDVFASLDSSIEPEVATQICESMGLFLKRKREKKGAVFIRLKRLLRNLLHQNLKKRVRKNCHCVLL